MTAAVSNDKDELTASSPLYTRKGLVTAASNDGTITLELVRSQFISRVCISPVRS